MQGRSTTSAIVCEDMILRVMKYYLLKLGIDFLACLSTCEFFYFLLQVVLADIIVLLLAVRQSIFAPNLQTFIRIVHDFSFSSSSLQAEAPGTLDQQWLAASQA